MYGFQGSKITHLSPDVWWHQGVKSDTWTETSGVPGSAISHFEPKDGFVILVRKCTEEKSGISGICKLCPQMH